MHHIHLCLWRMLVLDVTRKGWGDPMSCVANLWDKELQPKTSSYCGDKPWRHRHPTGRSFWQATQFLEELQNNGTKLYAQDCTLDYYLGCQDRQAVGQIGRMPWLPQLDQHNKDSQIKVSQYVIYHRKPIWLEISGCVQCEPSGGNSDQPFICHKTTESEYAGCEWPLVETVFVWICKRKEWNGNYKLLLFPILGYPNHPWNISAIDR